MAGKGEIIVCWCFVDYATKNTTLTASQRNFPRLGGEEEGILAKGRKRLGFSKGWVDRLAVLQNAGEGSYGTRPDIRWSP